ncbi:DUF4440 domain-containing protein [Variovorax sp. EL159]|uniref:DUF4440 domain-containing protein n=1 Tax=Variovorax sp. EL159 TaxID=1566270 RepID=UPI0008819A36|nr:DUF4440 domain-containing protein [Variovorax sp. EL159]SCX46254.1 hypothetical protein SAMN03159363_0936 [Variovorax sp. EL159]
MTMTPIHTYVQEIADTCVLIERLFNASAPDDATHAELLAHFAPEFSMLTTGGQRLDRAALAHFFATMTGRKQGLKIDVADLALLHESERGAVLTYAETQTLNGDVEVRLATVLLDRQEGGALRWRHLQETTRT